MLEQSESEGNSVAIARIRLKTLPEDHFIYKMWGFLRYYNIRIYIYIAYLAIKIRRNTIYSQTIDQVCIKIQFKVCKDSVKLKINFKKLNWIKWESTEGLSFKDFHSLFHQKISFYLICFEGNI